jgi:zinc protease
MATEIAARFSDWRSSAAPAGDPPPLQPVSDAGKRTRLFIHPLVPTSVTIARASPLGSGVDAGGRRDAHFLERLGSQMLNRRLAVAAAAPSAPFASAEISIYDHFNTVRLARLDVAARDREWRRALQAGARELRRALAGGFTQAELDEQLAATRKALVRAAAPARTPELADAIIDAVGRRIVFTAPADASGTDAYLSRVRLQDVNAAFKAAWGTSDPLILVSHHRRIARGEAAIAAAWLETVPAQAAR